MAVDCFVLTCMLQDLERNFGTASTRSGPKFSPTDLVRIASESDKPIYRLNKKELDDVVKGQGGK